MTAHAQNSVVFSGTAALQPQGTVNNSAYTGLSQWRVETRIHNLPGTWSGYIYAFAVGNFEIKLLYSTPTDRYLYFQDWTGATSGCNVDIGSRTDITLRAQRDGSATNETLRVWDSTGVELTNVGYSGTTRSGTDDLRGSATSGYLTIGGTTASGVDVLQGDMAYFRLFSAAASPTAAEPADPAAPAADLLDYEFEINLTDSSGKGQALTSLPSNVTFTYVSSGSSGGSQSFSLQFQGAAIQAQGAVNNSAYMGLSQWRVETRIHGLPPTWSGYIYAFAVGNFEIKLLYSTSTDRYLYFQDWTGATSGCNVDIGSRTDITLRAQRDGSATNETLRVWDSAGVELTNVGCSGTTRSGTDDLRGSATGGYLTIGGTPTSGVDVLQGNMAYFRLFSSPASPTAAEPADPAATPADLLDYEFENNITDSSGKSQGLTYLPSSGSSSYVPTGSGSVGPPTPGVTFVFGSGSTSTFGFTATSSGGYQYIDDIQAIFNMDSIVKDLDAVYACYVMYSQTGGYFLRDDTSQNWLPMIGGSRSNSQCTLNAAQSSISHTSGTLTVNFNITFKPILGGVLFVWEEVNDVATQSSGWTSDGGLLWDTTNPARTTIISVTATPGGGTTGTFTMPVQDADGYQYVSVLRLAIGPQAIPGQPGTCEFLYHTHWDIMQLNSNDNNLPYYLPSTTGLVGTGHPSLGNTQCMLDPSHSSFTASGTGLSMSLALTFPAPYIASGQPINAATIPGVNWAQKGSWAANPPGSTVPITIQTSPPGLSFTVDGQTFTTAQPRNWVPGDTSHSIGIATSPQSLTGTQYVYSGWSDGLGQTHGITVPSTATTFTASFSTGCTPGSFTLSASPLSQTVSAGTTPQYTISIVPTSGIPCATTFQGTGSGNNGVSFSPNPTPSGAMFSTMTVAQLTGSAPTMSGSSNIGATSSGHTSSLNGILWFITPANQPGFTISATPVTTQPVPPGAQATYSVTLTPTNNFSGQVSLSASGLPSGAQANPTVVNVSGTTTANLTVNTSPSTPTGQFQFNLSGSSGSVNPSASAPLNVQGSPVAPPLQITTSSLPGGTVGVAYSAISFNATGGTTPYSWSLVSGSLPSGLTLIGSTLSGTPTAAGTYSFRIKVTDNQSQTALQDFVITILPQGSSGPPASREYIRLGGRAIAVEHAQPTMSSTATVPAGAIAIGTATTGFTFGGTDSGFGSGNANSYLYLLINSSLSAIGGCILQYQPSTATVWLANDGGAYDRSAPLGSGVLSSSTNHQCSVDLSIATAPVSGNTVSLNGLSITFLSGFTGSKLVYTDVYDNGNDLFWQYQGPVTIQ